jgi:polyphosphate kinase 2 (PPK2 family)
MTLTLADVKPLTEPFLTKEDYEQALLARQEQLLHTQHALRSQGEKALILFEGMDASGKGGAIRRLTRLLDPRGFRVHAIAKPSQEERSRHYLWRFFRHLPPVGRITIFDRSWYGRVLVERVEAFASDSEWSRAYREISELERWLVDDGVRLVKIYLHIDRAEQDKRFAARLEDPNKLWKVTEEDLRNRLHWREYESAVSDMLAYTHHDYAPWCVIDARDKWQARIAVMDEVLRALTVGLDAAPFTLDQDLLSRARAIFGQSKS